MSRLAANTISHTFSRGSSVGNVEIARCFWLLSAKSQVPAGRCRSLMESTDGSIWSRRCSITSTATWEKKARTGNGGWLRRRDSNLCIFESECAKPFGISHQIARRLSERCSPRDFFADWVQTSSTAADRSSMPGCARNEQQDFFKMTGFPARTERHCWSMPEGLGPFRDSAPLA
jgi:hypothetical protein